MRNGKNTMKTALYRLPTHTLNSEMIQHIEINFRLTFEDFDFIESEQTGGWVMCDVYTSKKSDCYLIVGDDSACLYPSRDEWYQETIEGEPIENIDWSNVISVDWDDLNCIFPKENYHPTLFMMAQFWSEEKLISIIEKITRNITRGIDVEIMTDDLKTIKLGRKIKNEN